MQLVQMVNDRIGLLLEIESQIQAQKQKDTKAQGSFVTSELQLIKHMPRRTWTGAPYIESTTFVDENGKEILNVISTN